MEWDVKPALDRELACEARSNIPRELFCGSVINKLDYDGGASLDLKRIEKVAPKILYETHNRVFEAILFNEWNKIKLIETSLIAREFARKEIFYNFSKATYFDDRMLYNPSKHGDKNTETKNNPSYQ